MNRNITTITKTAALFAAILLMAAMAFAHEGFDHVTGTIAKVTGNVVTVTTSSGNVDVTMDAKTEITRNNQKAQVADLKPGTRVVIDIPEGAKTKVAHSIKLGVSSDVSKATH